MRGSSNDVASIAVSRPSAARRTGGCSLRLTGRAPGRHGNGSDTQSGSAAPGSVGEARETGQRGRADQPCVAGSSSSGSTACRAAGCPVRGARSPRCA